MNKSLMILLVAVIFSCNWNSENYDSKSPKLNNEYRYFTQFIKEANEPDLNCISINSNVVRVVLLSPMGLPSFIYTVKSLNTKEILISYKRHCAWNDSMEGKSWITLNNTIFDKLKFSKEFFIAENEQQESDNLMWVIEQKSKHGNNSRYLLGKSIQEKPEEIGNFFSHLPSYVPRIDSLISENCYIPYK